MVKLIVTLRSFAKAPKITALRGAERFTLRPNGLKLIKSSRMSWARSAIMRHTAGKKRHARLRWRNLKRRGYLGSLDVQEMLLLKWILNEQNWTVWTGSIYRSVGIRGGLSWNLLIKPYPTAFPYGNGMVLHFYQQQESSTTKTVHKVINKRLKTYV